LSSLKLKNKLQNHQFTLGSWISLAHPSIAEILCDAGFDWLTIDLEHSSISLREAEDLIRVIDLKDVCPIVRVSSHNESQIKRLLDAGAKGIIVPNICSSKEVKLIHSWMHYPQHGGNRGVGLSRAQKYGNSFSSYMNTVSNEIPLIVQIESTKAVENIESILSCNEVDALMIGPYDLSSSLGVPGDFNHPKYLEAVSTVRDCAIKYSKAFGIHLVEPDLEKLEAEKKNGAKFIAYSVDFKFLDCEARKAVSLFKALKDL
tara:strand:+ start:179648 stop:180427 length:780 start_codon:yes stop_codon:yes gene_type:complete